LGNTQLIVGGSAPSASTGIVITAINGFTSAVSFGCSGLPAGSSCSFSPSTLTPSGGFATGTLTITSTNAAIHIPQMRPSTGSGIAFAVTLMLVPFAFRKRRTAIRVLALLMLLAAGAQALTGCGGSTIKPITSNTVTVTGTATTGQTHTAAITLVVQ
jgi:heme A synthase